MLSQLFKALSPLLLFFRLHCLHVTKQQQKNDNKKLKFFAKRFQYFNWNDDYTVDYTAKYWNHSDYQRDSCVSLEQ